LWTTIDLSKKRQKYKKISPEFVKKCVKYSQYTLQTALLGSFDHQETIIAILRCCRELRVLNFGPQSNIGTESIMQFIPYSRRLESLIIGSVIGNHGLEVIMTDLPPLKEVRFQGLDSGPTFARVDIKLTFPERESYSNLEIFQLAGQCNIHEIRSPNFELVRLSLCTFQLGLITGQNFLAKAPNLRTLTLQACHFPFPVNFAKCPNLRHLDLSENIIAGEIELPPTLYTLKLHKIHGPLRLPQKLPALEELQYTNCQQGPSYLEALLRTDDSPLQEPFVDNPDYSRLKTLRICGARWTNNPSADQIFRSMSDYRNVLAHPRLCTVETLSIQSPELHDDSLEIIAQSYTSLKCARFADAKITGYGIKRLILAQDKLYWLILESCSDVSADAITWAENQGVKVSRHFQLVAESGRKVRHLPF
jgi:hypothetical protein